MILQDNVDVTLDLGLCAPCMCEPLLVCCAKTCILVSV